MHFVIFISMLLAIATASTSLAFSGDRHLDIPLTKSEQAARIESLGKSSLISERELFPAARSTTRPYTFYQRNYQTKWIKASSSGKEMRLLAEKIGEQGRARKAEELGLRKILGSGNRGLRQGIDAIYTHPANGKVYALESKGGKSRPQVAYKDAKQGSNVYSIRAAGAMLKSDKATALEKVGAARVLLAAEQRHLTSAVISTNHVLGRPAPPGINGGFDVSDVSLEARKIKNELIANKPVLAHVFKKARQQALADTFRRAGRQSISFSKNFVKASGLVLILYEGYNVGSAYYEYSTNQIGRRELARRTQSAKIIVGFAGVGAIGGGGARRPSGGLFRSQSGGYGGGICVYFL